MKSLLLKGLNGINRQQTKNSRLQMTNNRIKGFHCRNFASSNSDKDF